MTEISRAEEARRADVKREERGNLRRAPIAGEFAKHLGDKAPARSEAAPGRLAARESEPETTIPRARRPGVPDQTLLGRLGSAPMRPGLRMPESPQPARSPVATERQDGTGADISVTRETAPNATESIDHGASAVEARATPHDDDTGPTATDQPLDVGRRPDSPELLMLLAQAPLGAPTPSSNVVELARRIDPGMLQGLVEYAAVVRDRGRAAEFRLGLGARAGGLRIRLSTAGPGRITLHVRGRLDSEARRSIRSLRDLLAGQGLEVVGLDHA